MRNSLGYQTTADWRFLGKLNFSLSDSEQGAAYDTDFVEAVLGYAYRPVNNDELNTLFKCTYFYDLPSASALTATESMADYAQLSHINSNFKIGAGYNFTDFSDDLTDLDYDSEGWFINLIGKF